MKPDYKVESLFKVSLGTADFRTKTKLKLNLKLEKKF